jgi:hypothetical protein
MASTTTGSVSIAWTAPTGASSFRVYGRVSPQDQYWTAAASPLTDTGAAGTAGTVPTVTTAYVTRLTASGNSWLLGGNVGIGTTAPAAPLHVAGQCVTGDTRLRRRRRRKNVKGEWEDYFEEVEIVNIKPGDEILTLDERTGRLVVSRVKSLMDMGTKQIFKLTTSSGKSIRTTSNHPYFVRERRVLSGSFEVDQSKRIENLGVDSYIAIAADGFSAAVVIKKELKRQLFENYQAGRRTKYFGPAIWARTIAYLLQRHSIHNSHIVLDKEYSGYEPVILQILRTYAPDNNFVFEPIGRKSPAHRAAYLADKKPAGAPVLSREALDALHPEFTGISQPSSSRLRPDYRKVLDLSRAKWAKVINLSPGMEIAALDAAGAPVWDRITKIEILPPEQVYDIEVENTHNFVGNDIVAHNTFLATTGGNVGIGTTGPTRKLDVAITGDAIDGIAISRSGGTGDPNRWVLWNMDADAGYGDDFEIWQYPQSGGSLQRFEIQDDGDIYIPGNVGIGTTEPGDKLHVAGIARVDGDLKLGDSDNVQYLVANTGSTQLNLAMVGGGNVPTIGLYGNTIYASGNVGIGTTGPEQKLDVVGNIRFSGNLMMPQTGYVGTSALAPSRNLVSFPNPMYNDILQWRSPTAIEFWDGAGWATWTSPPDFALLTDARTGTGVSIPDTRKRFRLTYSIPGWSEIELIFIGSTYNMPSGTLLVESTPNDWITTNTRLATTAIIGEQWRYAILDSLTGADNLIRFTFDIAIPTGQSRTMSELQGMTLRADGYGTAFPYWWDKDRNIGIGGEPGSTSKLYVSGNVGIGTSTPGAKLHSLSAGTTQLRLGYDASNYMDFTTQADGSLYIAQDGGAATLALTNGSVGIGTVSPSVKLHVNESSLSASGVLINVATTSASYYSLNVQSADTSRLYVRADGNVGIGTTAPGAKLEVAGAVNATADASSVSYYLPGSGAIRTIGSGILYIDTAATNGGDIYFRPRTATAMVIQNTTGNVGIGTTGPAARLHVVQDISGITGDGQITAGGATTAGKKLRLGYQTTNNFAWIQSTNEGVANTDLSLNPNGGNVGIGTTNPSVKLHVNESSLSASGVLINVATTSASYYSLNVQSADTSRLYVRADGNVGIGTTGPGYKLDVQAGQVNASGGLCIAGDCKTSWPMGESVMYLRRADDEAGVPPADCPSGWSQADYQRESTGGTVPNLVRTCYHNSPMQVMYLRRVYDPNFLPAACPSGWSQADFQREMSGGNSNNVRTCYRAR